MIESDWSTMELLMIGEMLLRDRVIIVIITKIGTSPL